jgi:hypothetical protein
MALLKAEKDFLLEAKRFPKAKYGKHRILSFIKLILVKSKMILPKFYMSLERINLTLVKVSSGLN